MSFFIMRNNFELADLARVLVNSQPNPQNRPHTHIVGQARCIVDTHLGDVYLTKRVALREAIPAVRVASVGSYIVPNVLKTVVQGVNDRFYTRHTNTPVVASPDFILTHTLEPGIYTSSSFAVHVASVITTNLRAFNVAFTNYSVTGSDNTGTFGGNFGKLSLKISCTGGFVPSPTTQTFDLFMNGDSQLTRFEYFGVNGVFGTAPITLGISPAIWTSPQIMNMSRTSFLTVVSDLGSRTRIGPGMVRKTLLHIPFAGVSFGFSVSSQFNPGDLAHKLGETTVISSFEFDILDDSGKSVLAEFGGVPAIFELVFYQ